MAQLLKVSVPVPPAFAARLATPSSARTQPVLVAPVLACATARVVIVGPVDMNSADNSGVCGWLIRTST